jgi:hypothetical protein
MWQAEIPERPQRVRMEIKISFRKWKQEEGEKQKQQQPLVDSINLFVV